MLMELINNPDMYVIITAEDFFEFMLFVIVFVLSAEAIVTIGDKVCKKIKNKIKIRRETK